MTRGADGVEDYCIESPSPGHPRERVTRETLSAPVVFQRPMSSASTGGGPACGSRRHVAIAEHADAFRIRNSRGYARFDDPGIIATPDLAADPPTASARCVGHPSSLCSSMKYTIAAPHMRTTSAASSDDTSASMYDECRAPGTLDTYP